MPKVESIDPNLTRWTFTSLDPEVQRAQFEYWRGWFGFDETDQPIEVEGHVWLVRRTP